MNNNFSDVDIFTQSKPKIKHLKVASDIKHLLGTIFMKEIVYIPNLSLSNVVVTHIKVSEDVSIANIQVRFFGDINEKEAIESLNKHSPAMRHYMGKKLRLRSIPKLKFHKDTFIDEANKIHELIDNIKE